MKNKYFYFLIYIFLISIILIISISNTVAEITSDESKLAYDIASQKIEELQNNGYPTLPLLDMLNDAQTRYNYGNYNASKELSENVVSEAEKIVTLKINLLELSSQINALHTFGVDTIDIEMELLYIMADYEAANIDLAIEGKNLLSNKLFILAKNHSSVLYEELEVFKEYLENLNESNDLFNSYYESQKKNYNQKKFDVFLNNYLDFTNIKKIILLNIEFNNNLEFLESNNINFEGSKDLIIIFQEEISNKNYENALITISGGNNITLIAIDVFTKINGLTSEYGRLLALGIMDNKTSDLYTLVLSEFELGNFVYSKELLDQTLDGMVKLESDNILFGGISRASLKKGFIDFLKDYWLHFIVIISFSILTFDFFKNTLVLQNSKKNIRKFELDNSATIDMQKSLQKSYYLDKSMDKNDYKSNFEEFEEQKIQISSLISFNQERIVFCTNYFNNLKLKKDKLLSHFKRLKIKK